jgi:hypothetical protein
VPPGNRAIAGYVIVGWAVLTLVYGTVRLGRALAAASHEEFVIDPFDTTNLLPFGNIALAVSLAPAGVILILLLGLGQPNSYLSWTVLLGAASASILALLLPLRAIHRQMADAKESALATVPRHGRVRSRRAHRECAAHLHGPRGADQGHLDQPVEPLGSADRHIVAPRSGSHARGSAATSARTLCCADGTAATWRRRRLPRGG